MINHLKKTSSSSLQDDQTLNIPELKLESTIKVEQNLGIIMLERNPPVHKLQKTKSFF